MGRPLRRPALTGRDDTQGMTVYGGCAWGTLACAGFCVRRSVNPCTAATFLFDSGLEVGPIENTDMLKIVPDPPQLGFCCVSDLIPSANSQIALAEAADPPLLISSSPPETSAYFYGSVISRVFDRVSFDCCSGA